MENEKSPLEKPETRTIGSYEVQITPSLQDQFEQLDSLQTRIEDWKQRRPDLWPAVLHKLKVRWTADSNAIEGSTLTFSETLFFLEHGLTVKGKPFKDHLDARNHAEAVEIVLDAAANSRPISEGLLKEINSVILSGITHTMARDHLGQLVQKTITPGAYKQWPNHVVQADGAIHTYTEPLQVAPQMHELCAWIERAPAEMHPVAVAALAHYNFVRIHPFDDGNGRGARILMNLVLLRAGFPPAVVPVTDRQDYITALVSADRGDLKPFTGFIARHIQTTMENIIEDFETGTPRNPAS